MSDSEHVEEGVGFFLDFTEPGCKFNVSVTLGVAWMSLRHVPDDGPLGEWSPEIRVDGHGVVVRYGSVGSFQAVVSGVRDASLLSVRHA